MTARENSLDSRGRKNDVTKEGCHPRKRALLSKENKN